MNKIYIGYDESNNNSIPEFEIFVYSENKQYTQEIKSKKNYLKKGKDRNELFNEIIKEFNTEISFKYCIFFQEDLIKLNKFEPNQTIKLKKGLFLYSFLKEKNFKQNVDILLDGYMGSKKQDSEILNFLKFYFTNVNIEIKGNKADMKIPIINFADRIAYQFFNEYNNLGNKVFKNGIQSLANLTYNNRFYLKTDEFCKLLGDFRSKNK